METLVRRQAGLEQRCQRASVLAGWRGAAPAPTAPPWCSHRLFSGSSGIVHSPRRPGRSALIAATPVRKVGPSGMKPIPGQVRRMSPFGSPKRGRVARPDETKRRRRRVVQVDPSHGGTDARVPRQGRWRGSVAAPASRIHGRPGIAGLHPAAGRASRGPLNGFYEAFVGVLRHRAAGNRHRVSDTPPTGLSDARLGGEPDRSLGKYPQGGHRGRRGDRPPHRHRAGSRGADTCGGPGRRC